MSSREIEALALKPLKTLKSLELMISNQPFTKGLLYQILDKFRDSLESVSLLGVQNDETPKLPTYLSLPEMKKLTFFKSASINTELPANLSGIENYIPAVTNLVLLQQSENTFKKWTENSNFESVTHLTVSLSKNVQPTVDFTYPVTFDLDLMERLRGSFSNLKWLEIQFCVYSSIDLDGIQYIFRELRQLETLLMLKLTYDGFLTADIWEALLIGVPMKWGKPVFDKTTGATMPADDKNAPSIRNLTEMRTLGMKSGKLPSHQGSQEPMISNHLFDLAFFRMTRLKSLILEGRFRVSPEMTEKWKAQWGSIRYTPERRQERQHYPAPGLDNGGACNAV